MLYRGIEKGYLYADLQYFVPDGKSIGLGVSSLFGGAAVHVRRAQARGSDKVCPGCRIDAISAVHAHCARDHQYRPRLLIA